MLVFGKGAEDGISAEIDNFVGGPDISGNPEAWLKANLWRLRGLRAMSGKLLSITKNQRESKVHRVKAQSKGNSKISVKIERGDCTLLFQKSNGSFKLIDFSMPKKKFPGKTMYF